MGRRGFIAKTALALALALCGPLLAGGAPPASVNTPPKLVLKPLAPSSLKLNLGKSITTAPLIMTGAAGGTTIATSPVQMTGLGASGLPIPTAAITMTGAAGGTTVATSPIQMTGLGAGGLALPTAAITMTGLGGGSLVIATPPLTMTGPAAK